MVLVIIYHSLFGKIGFTQSRKEGSAKKEILCHFALPSLRLCVKPFLPNKNLTIADTPYCNNQQECAIKKKQLSS